MDWTEAFKLLPGYISALGFVVTATMAWKIYKRQRDDTNERSRKQNESIQEQARREARASITQAYFRLNAEILRSTESINIVKEIMYPQYDLFETRYIIFMYMVLNSLHLEWRFYKDHGHPKKEFVDTLNKMIGSIAKNTKPSTYFLIKDFENIFGDFSKEFKDEVLACIKCHDPYQKNTSTEEKTE